MAADINHASGSVDPTENLTAWIQKRDAEPEAPTGQLETPDSPAEPTVAQAVTPEAQPEPNWWDTGFAEAQHGFLKDKKGPEVEKAFRHVETAKQKAEREAAELRRELEQMRRDREADAAVRRVTAPPTAVQPEPDKLAEIASMQFVDPAKAEQMRMEQYREETRRVTQETIQQERESQAAEYRANAAKSAAATAAQQLSEKYGWDQERAAAAVMSSFSHLAFYADQDPNVWLNSDNYVSVVSRIVGDPVPAAPTPTIVIPPSPTELADPPGAKRPVSATTRPTQPSSMLSSEEEATRRQVARITGLDPDRFIKRARR